MASIREFTGMAGLRGHSKTGLNNMNGSTTRIIVVGDSLDDLTLWVKKKDGVAPWWQGPLVKTDTPNGWYADVVCKYSSSGVGTPGGDGDPGDVPVTVSAGSDANSAPAATLDTSVPVGIGT